MAADPSWEGLGQLVPVGTELPSLATLAILAAVLSALIAYEAHRFAEARERVRHSDA